MAVLSVACNTLPTRATFVHLLSLCPPYLPLSLPDLGGLEQQDAVARGMRDGTHSDGRAVDSEGSGCEGEE